MKILHVVGARPNFIKAAAVIGEMGRRGGFDQILVHTGQHYYENMSKVFFDQLGIPKPDINLEVGSGSHAAQTAEIMARFEKVVLERRPDWVVVYGDVNSTVAAALTCAKLLVPVAHVEAGLRSFDRTMPEEINRLLTDQLSSLLFTHSESAGGNLADEGIDASKVHFVGNTMIDTLIRLRPKFDEARMDGFEKDFGLVTLHRPSNVDEPGSLRRLMETISGSGRGMRFVFPVHPRTRARLEEFGIGSPGGGLELLDPLGYLEFLALLGRARLVITDSGGVQEESTFLGVPCLTMRENTERPVTVDSGTNILVGRDTDRLRAEIDRILNGERKKGRVPPLWDGEAARRIVDAFGAP